MARYSWYGAGVAGPKEDKNIRAAGPHPHSDADVGIQYSLNAASPTEKQTYLERGGMNQGKESYEPANKLAQSNAAGEYRQPYPVTEGDQSRHLGGGNHDYALSLCGAALMCGQATDFMKEKLPSEDFGMALKLAAKRSTYTQPMPPGERSAY